MDPLSDTEVRKIPLEKYKQHKYKIKKGENPYLASPFEV
jgi:hypothetical protein